MADPPGPQFYVKDLIPEGVTVIAGPPKHAKSWMGLQLCVAVASGGTALGAFEVKKSKSLYFALEDNAGRLNQRMKQLMSDEEWPPDCFFQLGIQANEMLSDPVKHLDSLLQEVDASFIVIDTMSRFMLAVPKKRDVNAYYVEYAMMEPFQTYALEKHVAVVFIHHFSKRENTNDVFERFSGTQAISGGADNLVGIVRAPAGITVATQGRDIGRNEWPAEFDMSTGLWTVHTGEYHVDITKEQFKVLEVLGKGGSTGMFPEAVAKQLRKSDDAARKLLYRLERDGKVEKTPYNTYKVKETIV